MLISFFLREYRQRNFWLSIASIGLLAWSSGRFAGSLALVESGETALALTAWSLRWMLVLFLVIWWVGSLVREKSERFDQVLFSLPISRFRLLWQRMAAWFVIGLLLAVLFAALLWFLGASPRHLVQWSLSFTMELWLVAAISLFVMTLFNSVGAGVMSVLMWYLFMRLLPYLVALSRHDWSESRALDQSLSVFMQGLAAFVPGLHRYASTEMLLHGTEWTTLFWQAAQSLAFVLVLLLAGGFDLTRKELDT